MANNKTSDSKSGKEPQLEEIVGLDDIIHSPPRLAIMMFLLPRLNSTFSIIQKALGLTSGNLSIHLSKLEKNEMVETQKAFVDAKPTTVVYLTEFGRKRLQEYAKILVEILEKMLEVVK
jgi:DNA-binding MarR family transcriptional regulator